MTVNEILAATAIKTRLSSCFRTVTIVTTAWSPENSAIEPFEDSTTTLVLVRKLDLQICYNLFWDTLDTAPLSQ